MNTSPADDDPSPAPSELNSSKPRLRVISGFWRRLTAFIVDSIVLGIAGSVLGWTFFDWLSELGPAARLIGFGVATVYFGIFNSSVARGKTPGKRLMEIEVVDRNGLHISIGRAVVRSVILSVPFFLNGLLLPASVQLSVIGYLVGLLVFGLGGAIVYLLAFNRRTRQSVHDLAIGTFVVRTGTTGEVPASRIWRPHFAIMAAAIVLVLGSSFALGSALKQSMFAGLLELQSAIQSTGKVHAASVSIGQNISWKSGMRNSTSYVHATVLWKTRPEDYALAAREIAAVVNSNYADAQVKDAIAITVRYGFDIGIATGSVAETVTHSPAEWRALVIKE